MNIIVALVLLWLISALGLAREHGTTTKHYMTRSNTQRDKNMYRTVWWSTPSTSDTSLPSASMPSTSTGLIETNFPVAPTTSIFFGPSQSPSFRTVPRTRNPLTEQPTPPSTLLLSPTAPTDNVALSNSPSLVPSMDLFPSSLPTQSPSKNVPFVHNSPPPTSTSVFPTQIQPNSIPPSLLSATSASPTANSPRTSTSFPSIRATTINTVLVGAITPKSSPSPASSNSPTFSFAPTSINSTTSSSPIQTVDQNYYYYYSGGNSTTNSPVSKPAPPPKKAPPKPKPPHPKSKKSPPNKPKQKKSSPISDE